MSALWRPAAVALAVLALLILLSASAARGLAAGPGDALWIHWYDGPAHDLDAIVDVAQAPDGSLYAAGVMNDDWAAGGDMLLMRSTRSGGAGSWSLTWDGPAHNADSCGDLVVDGKSNAVMVGTSLSVAKQHDWQLVKYSSARVLKWQKPWGGVGDDWSTDAVGDADGNVYVCGTYQVSPTVTDWKVVKFRALTGSVAWTCTFSGPATNRSGDMPTAMARDKAGNLYVSGLSRNTGGGTDAVVIKVSPRGRLLWKRRIDGGSHLFDQGAAVVPAPSGGAYVAVESWTGSNVSKLVLARLSSSGRFVWASKWRNWHDPLVPGLTSVRGVQLDAAGNVYLAGYSWDTSSDATRAYLQKRDAAGRLRWVRHYAPAGVARSAFYDFVVDAAGRSWVAGTMTPTGGTRDWLLARYEANGKRAWVSTFDTPSHLDDWVNSVTLWGTRSVFAGGVVGTATNDDAGVGKFLR